MHSNKVWHKKYFLLRFFLKLNSAFLRDKIISKYSLLLGRILFNKGNSIKTRIVWLNMTQAVNCASEHGFACLINSELPDIVSNLKASGDFRWSRPVTLWIPPQKPVNSIYDPRPCLQLIKKKPHLIWPPLQFESETFWVACIISNIIAHWNYIFTYSDIIRRSSEVRREFCVRTFTKTKCELIKSENILIVSLLTDEWVLFQMAKRENTLKNNIIPNGYPD